MFMIEECNLIVTHEDNLDMASVSYMYLNMVSSVYTINTFVFEPAGFLNRWKTRMDYTAVVDTYRLVLFRRVQSRLYNHTIIVLKCSDYNESLFAISLEWDGTSSRKPSSWNQGPVHST